MSIPTGRGEVTARKASAEDKAATTKEDTKSLKKIEQ